MRLEGQCHGAAVTASLLDLPGFERRTTEPKTYDGETPEARTARRKALWSPADLALLETST